MEGGGEGRTAASMLAGLSSLGSESILMTDATSPSTPRIGRDGGSEGGREARTTKTREGGREGRTAASMLAGLSSLGSESILMTDTIMASTPRMGRQRSSADSWELNRSSPGGWRMEMQTRPSS